MKFDKSDFELEVFREFCRVARLRVDAGTIQQLQPPQPDVVCAIDGVFRRFELTLITDSAIEKKVRKGLTGGTSFKIEVQDVLDRIRSKSQKSYVDGPSIELVLHEGATPIDDLCMYDQTELDARILDEVEASPFLRVWLIDFSNEVCRCYTKLVPTSVEGSA